MIFVLSFSPELNDLERSDFFTISLKNSKSRSEAIFALSLSLKGLSYLEKKWCFAAVSLMNPCLKKSDFGA